MAKSTKGVSMNITDLNDFLYLHTSGELWHLAHPNELSPRYEHIPIHTIQNQPCYYFDFERSLRHHSLAIVKETRYTTIPSHYHKDMELNYIYEGSCTFVINGKTITLKQGDLCILDSNVIHSATSLKTYHDMIINIVFKKEFFNSAFLSRLSSKGIITNFLYDAISQNRNHKQYLIFRTQNNFKFHSLIQFLLCEYYFPSSCDHELISVYASAIFIELINTLHEMDEHDQWSRNHKEIINILQYIEQHYKYVTLDDLANEFGYSKNYLSASLKKHTGKSFVQLKTSQQLTEAAFLFLNSNKSINEIIEKVGCHNYHYFYRKFEEKYCCTPKEFRSLKSSSHTE